MKNKFYSMRWAKFPYYVYVCSAPSCDGNPRVTFSQINMLLAQVATPDVPQTRLTTTFHIYSMFTKKYSFIPMSVSPFSSCIPVQYAHPYLMQMWHEQKRAFKSTKTMQDCSSSKNSWNRRQHRRHPEPKCISDKLHRTHIAKYSKIFARRKFLN